MNDPILRPTMRQIAREGGVTAATVSMALRDSPRIQKETRRRIGEIAARLGYRPNPLVSAHMHHVRASRASEYRCTLAYISPLSREEALRQDATYQAFFSGAVRRGEELGYRVEHFTLGGKGMTGPKLSMVLRHRGIPGAIIAPMERSQRHIRIDFGHLACAAIGYSLWKPDLHRVCNHQYRTALMAARELRRRGYRRAAVVISAEDNRRTYYSWEAGFQVAARHYVDRMEFLFFPGEILQPARVLAWLARVKPDVVVGVSAGILRSIAGGPWKVPRAMGILDLDCLNNLELGFSGIDQNSSLIGGTAVEVVAAQIERNERGIPPHPQIVLVSGTWHEGGTLRPIVRSDSPAAPGRKKKILSPR